MRTKGLLAAATAAAIAIPALAQDTAQPTAPAPAPSPAPAVPETATPPPAASTPDSVGESGTGVVSLSQEQAEAQFALQRQGLSAADVNRLMAPRDAHEEQLVQEMRAYVTLQRGSFGMTPGA